MDETKTGTDCINEAVGVNAFMDNLRQFVIAYTNKHKNLFDQLESEGKNIEIKITIERDTIGGNLRFY